MNGTIRERTFSHRGTEYTTKAVSQGFGYLIRVFRGRKLALPMRYRVSLTTAVGLDNTWGIDAIDELMNVAEGHVKQLL